MTNLNSLKVFAGLIVMESDLSNPSKLQLLNFLQYEATIPQVKAFILDGEIVNLDEQSIEIVNDRFAVSEAGGKVAQFRKSAVSVTQGPQMRVAMAAVNLAKGDAQAAAIGLGTIGVWGLYRLVRAKFDKCTKTCGTFKLNLPKRQYCMIKCKVAKLQADVNAATKAKNQKEIAKKKVALGKAKTALANFNKTLKK